MSSNFTPKVSQVPSLFCITTSVSPTEKLLFEAECDLLDSAKLFAESLRNEPEGTKKSAERYKGLAEIYVHEYDNHYRELSTILELEGVIVEMYSDIYSFEKTKGETEKSKAQKTRLLFLRNGFETLKMYFTKYDQLKLIHKNSVMERQRLVQENKILKQQIESMKNAESF